MPFLSKEIGKADAELKRIKQRKEFDEDVRKMKADLREKKKMIRREKYKGFYNIAGKINQGLGAARKRMNTQSPQKKGRPEDFWLR